MNLEDFKPYDIILSREGNAHEYEPSFEYTQEDLDEMRWDALTDGQYGPYQGRDIDTDLL